MAVGAHLLTAVASDNFGASATSSAVTVTVVTNSPPTVAVLLANVSLTNGQFSFAFSTQEGHTYAVQDAPVLDSTAWVTLTNFFGAGSPAQFTISGQTNSSSYYRIAEH